jgi:hypothetical protein
MTAQYPLQTTCVKAMYEAPAEWTVSMAGTGQYCRGALQLLLLQVQLKHM